VTIATEPFNIDLHEALNSAVERCRDALADYRAGLLDDLELRRVLVGAGLVQRPSEVWLLDLEADRWWRYDGIVVGAQSKAATNEAVGRFRQVIDDLSGHARSSLRGLDER
jgi:hypothetical protein